MINLLEIALVFLKLGMTAFGGPAAHVAMMNREMVKKRAWITQEHFLDLLGAASFIPGPSSTELAIYIGYARAGWRGLLIAGICFIFPAAMIVSLFAWAYVKFGSLPLAQSILYGVKPVIIAVVIQAIWSLGQTAVKSKFLAVLGLAAAIANFFGMNVLMVLFASAVLSLLSLKIHSRQKLWASWGAWPATKPALISALSLTTATSVAFILTPVTLEKLFLFFLKVGAFLFGGGYVLLAFLRTDLVDHWHWLTESQLLDAIAVGQFTPGPVFTTATFIGYVLAGYKGAIVATIGIFLPAFLLVGLTASFIFKIRKSALASAAFDGVNVASLAVMAVACVVLAREAVVDYTTLTIVMASGFLLFYFKINSAWLVLCAGAVGYLLQH